MRATRTLLGTAAVLTLAACGPVATTASHASGPTLPPTSSSVPAPTTSADPSLSPRGTLIKTLGEQAGWGNSPSDLVVAFTVDSIAPVRCDAPYHSGQPTGTLVGAHVRMSTAASAKLSDLAGIPTMNPAQWEFVGPDGITHSGQEIASIATYGCLTDAESFPQSQLAPGSQYVGTLVFDLPAAHGALIYAPGGLNNAHGWEWDF